MPTYSEVSPEELEEKEQQYSPSPTSEQRVREMPRISRRREVWTPEYVPWKQDLRPQFIEAWKASGDGAEHVSVIGTTGSGKTTLVLDILRGKLNQDRTTRALILMNKRRDTTMRDLIDRDKIAHIHNWDELAYKHRVKRLIVCWPDYPESLTKAREKAKEVFREVLDGVMREGDWILYIDEASYMIEQLGLRIDFDEYWNSARSNGISVVSGGQRPVWISKSMTSQHSWFFAFYIKSLEDRKNVGMSVGDTYDVPAAIAKLERHEFLLLHTDGNEGYVSDVTT
jgi:hypothetical protein